MADSAEPETGAVGEARDGVSLLPTTEDGGEGALRSDGRQHKPVAMNHRPMVTLCILTGIYAFSFIDRYIPSALKDLYKADLQLSDFETSVPLTVFLIVVVVSSPIFGYLSDKGVSRKGLLAAGVVVWSLATAGAALTSSFMGFVVARAFVGLGEAAYSTVGITLLSDSYRPADRNRIMSWFLLAIPVGAATGFMLGGMMGPAIGWRNTFLFCGLPGLVLACLIFIIRDPGHGVFDDPLREEDRPSSWKDALLELPRNKPFCFGVGGMILITFAMGGLADWMPTYLHRVGGMDIGTAGTVFGGASVVGGIAGTKIGALLGEGWFKRNTRNPYLAVTTCSIIPGTLAIFLGLMFPNKIFLGLVVFVSNFFLWFYNAPINAMIANSVPSRLRARAFAVDIVLIHVLGDAISPSLVGSLSDQTHNLSLAMAVLPLALLGAALVYGIGWRTLPNESSTSAREASSSVDELS